MYKIQHHMRERTHTYHHAWHIGHWMHDARFWTLLAVIIVMAIIIAGSFYLNPSTHGIQPGYPYVP